MRNPLDLIEQEESRGRNVPNYKYGPGFTASGHYQIVNETWRRWAKAAGVDISQYPTAMSAPKEVQRAVATHGFKTEGFRPWEAVKHLRGQEARYNTTAAPTPQTVTNIQDLQAKLLERYPELRVTSGYRDPAYNAKVGGAKNSQHTHGRAIDMSLKGLDEARQREVVEYARSLGARGIGYYPSNQSVHFDVRAGAPAAWGGNYSRTSLPQTPAWFQDVAKQHLQGGGGGTPAAATQTAVAAAPGPTSPLPDVAAPDRGILSAALIKLTADAAKEKEQQRMAQVAEATAPPPPQPAPAPAPAPMAPPPQPVDYAGLLLPRIKRGLLADDYSSGLLGAG